VEWGQSGGSDLLAFIRGRPFGSCPATDFEVRTYHFSGGLVLGDNISFNILVP
jgi:hypothetical protein